MTLKNLLVISLITLSGFHLPAWGKQDRCLALCLKGGANRGSYEAGVVKAFVEKLTPEEVQYDVVSGISVGALNAAHVATYPRGEEVRMSEELLGLWYNLTEKDLYQSWTGGVISGLFYEKGLFDNKPLHTFIDKHFKGKHVHRLVHFNSVDANTGNVVRFDESSEKDDFIRGLVATTSVPFIFPPIKVDDKILIDGGVAWNLDVASAINKCRTLVDDDSKIILDIIDVDKSVDRLPRWNSTGNAISNYNRLRQIKNYYTRMNDMLEITSAHPKVQVRYAIMPKEQLDPLYQELSLDKELIMRMIEQGYQDALEAMETQTTLTDLASLHQSNIHDERYV